jgi:nucleoside-diphosphate-sugar epimerase
MRVVVTGSAGRVGRALLLRLARRHEVVGIDRFPASTAVKHVGDIADRELLDAAFADADAVIHSAALHSPHVGVVPDAEFERVNVEGTRAVLAAASAAGARRIVFTSTTALYGCAASASGRAAWIDERAEPNPITIYHRTKLVAEEVLREAARDGLEVRILRMSRCFPEPADVMGVYRLHRGIDARDVAAAHEAALTHVGESHHTWVISGATPFQRSDLETLLEDAPAVLRRRAPELVAAYADRGWLLPETIDRVYVPAGAMRELDWQPRHGFGEVLGMWDQQIAEVLPPLRDAR